MTSGAAMMPSGGQALLATAGAAVRRLALAAAVLTALAAAAVGTASLVRAAAHPRHPGSARLLAVRARVPAFAASVLSGPPDVLAADVARQLLASAPLVVIADARRPADLRAAAAAARRAGAPLLLSPAASALGAAPAEIRLLGARAVLPVGVTPAALSARIPRARIIGRQARLPAARAAAPAARVAVLVTPGSGAAGTAAAATARAAGALVVTVDGYDPRADPSAIAALAAARPRHVIALGAGFGPAALLASRVAVAETGVQLPDGGQVLFPMRRLVALYGHPGAPGLGALGQQGLRASIARARRMAGMYRALSGVPVVPAFEIIATVAQASAGRNASYSRESTAASLVPWVRGAAAAGMYVVLDLQPGRDSFLAQARRYEALLRLPDVGLALDPEWKLGPGQLPLRQIGSVSAAEVNGVIAWLAALTARYHLPQKLLVLHQFRLSMLDGEHRLDTRHDDLAIVIHMDGQGTPAEKQQTWDTVAAAAPRGAFLGWKNFFVKDHPMLTPAQTMARTPEPVMISYQ